MGNVRPTTLSFLGLRPVWVAGPDRQKKVTCGLCESLGERSGEGARAGGEGRSFLAVVARWQSSTGAGTRPPAIWRQLRRLLACWASVCAEKASRISRSDCHIGMLLQMERTTDAGAIWVRGRVHGRLNLAEEPSRALTPQVDTHCSCYYRVVEEPKRPGTMRGGLAECLLTVTKDHPWLSHIVCNEASGPRFRPLASDLPASQETTGPTLLYLSV